jgi:subtilisin-like proprotein convertase family protein
MKRMLVAASLLAGVVGCGPGATSGGGSGPGSSSTDLVALRPEAIAQMELVLAEKAGRSAAQRKISSQLLYARDGLPTGTGKTKPVPLQSLMTSDGAGRMLVDIKGELDASALARLEGNGGKVVTSSPAHRSLRAWVKAEALEAVASEATVQSVRPALLATTDRYDHPRYAGKTGHLTREQRVAALQRAMGNLLVRRPSAVSDAMGGITQTGSVLSQGSTAMGAERARKFFNVDGTGIKIGVLSDSDDGKESSIATGDLPPDTVTVPGQDGRPGAGEGTAMMEIVHDVAPGAKLFFATAFNSPESFADNIRTLRFTYGCDIIVDDVVYFFESPYQDDIIAQAVDEVTDDGGMYFSSAGNEGNFDDGTSGTWEGDFKNGGALSTLPSGYTVHDFGDKVISNRIEATGGPLILHWSDRGTLDDPESANDYDLFVLDADLRNVIVASTDIQDGTGLPFEFLGFLIPPDFRVVVAKHPGAAKRAIRIEHFRGELGLATPGSVFGHNSAEQAFAVAAVDAAEAGGAEFTGGPTTPVETYSADGNRQIFYDRNGHHLSGGVTFESGGGEIRKKPDLAGADGVSTTLPSFTGLNPFFGTSAAAPHVAAVAGLLKSAVPHASNNRIRNALINGALDIEAKGVDRDSGAGIVSAFDSLLKIGAQPAVFLELGTVTATPSSGTAIVPGGGGTLAVQLVNSGGATAGVVKGTLSTSTPGVTITTANSNYPSIGPGGSGTNLTPFAFTLDPGADCGLKVDFQLSVTFVGRGTSPTVLSFSVQTGKTSATPTVFSFTGLVAIPDADPVGVDIPLPVAFGRISKAGFSIDGTVCTADVGATTVGLDHTFVGDLIAILTSPGGTSVTLFRQLGGGGNSGNNFCQTVLDDGAATSIQDLTADQAPFTGTFRPASPLAGFNGEIANGSWNLNVSDNAFIDIGNVRAFSLRLSGFDCSP